MLHNKNICTSLYDCNDAALFTVHLCQCVFNKGNMHVDVAAPGKRKQIFQLEITKLGNGNRGVSAAIFR